MFKRSLLFALVLAPALHAQGHLLLDEDAARKNLIHSPAPVTPAGVHVTGKVVLLVEIAPDGHVLAAKPDTGNSRLREAAVDAVKTWRFKPFTVHNTKVAADTKLTVEFGSQPAPAPVEAPVAAAKPVPADESIAQRFDTLEEQCRTLVAANADPAGQAKACRAAADVADKLYGDKTFVPRRAAYVYAATAFSRTNNLKAAEAYATKAIAVAREGHDDPAGLAAAYTSRGQARAFAGNLNGADQDLTIAESYDRQALTADPANHAALRNLLLFHAKLLTALKQPDQAAARTAEAGKL